MELKILEKLNELQRDLVKVENAIKLFDQYAPSSRVAVSTGFEHYHSSLHELGLPDELQTKLRKSVIAILSNEKEWILEEIKHL